MKKQVTIRCLLVSLSLVLLVSCGKISSTGAESTNFLQGENISSSQSVEQKEEKKEEAYEKFRKAEKENVIGDEEQQLAELSAALEKLQFQYAEVEGFGDVLFALSPNCIQNEEVGQSCVASFIYIFGPSIDPILGVGFNYIGDQYMDMDTVEIDTDSYRYTFNSTTFAADVQKDKIVISPSQEERTEEMALRLATEDDIDMMIDMVKSDEVSLRFGKYNSAKPELVECPMPENDKQAIVDVLNAYYLYLNTTQAVRAKALAALE